MKIALVHKRLDLKGGTERDLYCTAEGLRDLGHEVHLFCSEFAVEAPVGTFTHAVPVLPLGRTARLWSFAVSASRILRQHPCDVVIGFGRVLEQDIIRCGGGTHRGFLRRLGVNGGAARRLWQKSSVYHQSLLVLEKRQFQEGRFKKIVAVSNEVKRDVMEHYAVAGDRITVVYNGVDAERFHPSRRCVSRSIIRERWHIPPEAPLVLFVGSGFQRKGLERLLTAWALPALGGFYLMVVGDDAKMGYYRSWAERIAPGRVVFTGLQNRIEDFYGSSDIVALPSVQEAFGNVVLEGLASGLPVLVSRAVGAAELLTGSLAQGIVDWTNDQTTPVNTLVKLLERGRNPSFTAEARRLAESYSWPNHFRKLETVLSSVHESNRAKALR
jgi:UDP-glucose:(heptosyl)LPS alpha-1,3-glucosyltransferase